MAQVAMACGDFRVVSLVSRDACDELRLEIGQPVTAIIKATQVIIEVASNAGP